MIGCTQPRRVAAMSVAKRVSDEMGVKLGEYLCRDDFLLSTQLWSKIAQLLSKTAQLNINGTSFFDDCMISLKIA